MRTPATGAPLDAAGFRWKKTRPLGCENGRAGPRREWEEKKGKMELGIRLGAFQAAERARHDPSRSGKVGTADAFKKEGTHALPDRRGGGKRENAG